MQREYKVFVEREEREERFVFCTRTNVALMVFTLFLVGSAAAVLLTRPDSQGTPQQEGHFDELRHSLRQTNVRDAIHLDGKYNVSMETVVWQQDTDQSFVRGELKVENNEVVIPRDGLYFVYSQASYQLSCSNGNAHSLVHLSHMVERWSDSYGDAEEREYRPILHSIRTACERPPQQGHLFTGVYVGAMFNLIKGDRLRTSLTKDPQLLSQLQDEHGETFFGVFAL